MLAIFKRKPSPNPSLREGRNKILPSLREWRCVRPLSLRERVRVRVITCAIALFFLLLTNALANSDWVKSENIQARFVDENGKLGVEMQVEPGWHTYYKYPGDAGYPTQFSFNGSSG
jgi:hypothetical protein